MIADKIFSDNAGLIMDYQTALANLVGNREWNIDTDAGQITFGGDDDCIVRRIQLIGTYSNSSSTWRWADENEGFRGPSSLVTEIHDIRTRKYLSLVEPLSMNDQMLTGGISGLNQWDLAFLVVAIAQKPAFMCPYDGGQLFVLVCGVNVTGPETIDEFVDRYKKSTRMLVYENQDQALKHYAAVHGYICEDRGETIAIIGEEQEVLLHFCDGFLSE
ncbi:MAG: DUF6882 domain-containing protein [Chloroflexota bacterium]